MSPGQIVLNNFFYLNGENSLEQLDDTAENLKRMKPILSKDYKSVNTNSFNWILPMSYSVLLDSFRGNYDDYN
jgi:hypothetical protein